MVDEIIKKTNVSKESIPLAAIYKKDGLIHIDVSPEANPLFELLGFLKCYVIKLEDDLVNSMTDEESGFR